MTVKFNDHELVNIKHSAKPQAGDYWAERYSVPCFLVIESTDFSVSFISKTKTVNGDKFWDVSHIESCTPKEFQSRVSYGSISGTWCDCTPNWKHAKEYIEEAKVTIV